MTTLNERTARGRTSTVVNVETPTTPVLLTLDAGNTAFLVALRSELEALFAFGSAQALPPLSGPSATLARSQSFSESRRE
jgi:hypothetical protein